jgi:altronate hydrolase
VLCFTNGRLRLRLQTDALDQLGDEQPDVLADDRGLRLNCGEVLDGVSIEAKGREIFERVLAVASGERSKSESLGRGEAEFAPWQLGATM